MILANTQQQPARERRRVLAARWPGVMLIALCLCVMVLWLSVQRSAALPLSFGWQAFSLTAPTPTTAPQRPVPTPSAGHLLIRLSQLDPKQYANSQEFTDWAYSACSTASMAEVINAYRAQEGKGPYRITTILAAEIQVHAISSDQGLLDGFHGIRDTVTRFGFQATDLSGNSLDSLISTANGGEPVIVAWPPQTWDGGHLLVLRGGDAQNVQLADSSKLDIKTMTRAKFLRYWRGFAVLVKTKS